MNELLPWLAGPGARFAEMKAHDRMPHAFLIAGLPGSGKAALAYYLAGRLLCEDASNAVDACGQCPGCRQYAAGTHADYFFVEEDVDDKTGEKKKTIGIGQIRKLAHDLSLSSNLGGYKVAVINPAGSMTRNSANALLKTLEEPADNTVLVLVCEQPARLPATIRSRCQQLRIETPGRQQGLEWLDKAGAGSDAAACLALAGGAPLEALRLSSEGVLALRRDCFAGLRAVLDGREGALKLAAEWAGDETLQGVKWLRTWLMDLLKIALSGEAVGICSADLKAELAELAPRLDRRVLFAQLDRINRALRVSDGSLNRQLAVEEILLDWAAMRRVT